MSDEQLLLRRKLELNYVVNDENRPYNIFKDVTGVCNPALKGIGENWIDVDEGIQEAKEDEGPCRFLLPLLESRHD